MSNIKRLLCGVLTLFLPNKFDTFNGANYIKNSTFAKEFSLDKLIKEIENKTDYTFVFE